MSSIAHALKAEISRVARKELRGELQSVKKAVASYRTQIAELKRQVKQLQQDLKSTRKASKQSQSAQTASSEGGSPNMRFSAKGLASQRARLGLSVVATAKILGVSPQSVTNWESGTTRPRESQMAAIATLRKMGKREAAARLAS
jgi:DNA-binding transcriptional regulator YiaG